jgi:hypothetical protein
VPHYDEAVALVVVVLGDGITLDTFEGSQTDPLSLHKYVYCANDPVNNVDPSGQFEFSIGGFTASISIGTYLATTAGSYAVGKGISATYLTITEGNLNRFQVPVTV